MSKKKNSLPTLLYSSNQTHNLHIWSSTNKRWGGCTDGITSTAPPDTTSSPDHNHGVGFWRLRSRLGISHHHDTPQAPGRTYRSCCYGIVAQPCGRRLRSYPCDRRRSNEPCIMGTAVQNVEGSVKNIKNIYYTSIARHQRKTQNCFGNPSSLVSSGVLFSVFGASHRPKYQNIKYQYQHQHPYSVLSCCCASQVDGANHRPKYQHQYPYPYPY